MFGNGIPPKPWREWTQQELRKGLIGCCAGATLFLIVAGLFAWQFGLLSFPVLFCCVCVVVLVFASRRAILELRNRKC
jgi:type IV secretory pathway VirB2 component (pilin)